MFTIIGSGFGMYGYLPAVVRLHGSVILDKRYYNIVRARPELCHYLPRIKWKNSRESALESATGVIIAIAPVNQSAIGRSILSMQHISDILLEKPVAPTPVESQRLLVAATKACKNIRLGYNLEYTDWYAHLVGKITLSGIHTEIEWTFMAHHFKNNKETWKRYHSQGGGVLRFYGIHLIAILAYLGFDQPISSSLEFLLPDQPVVWHAKLKNKHGAEIVVHVSSLSDTNKFIIRSRYPDNTHGVSYSSRSPFISTEDNCMEDSRIPVLQKLLNSFSSNNRQSMSDYQAVNSLWSKLEALH